MLIAALFVTTPNWKQSQCPSVGEWVNTLWHNGIILSGKKGMNCCHTEAWRELKGFMLSEKTRLKRLCDAYFSLHNILQMSKL